jgi:hypothetical protein
MKSLNGNKAWEGNIKREIARSIHDFGKTLVDLTGEDDIVGHSIVAKDEPSAPE